MFRSPSEMHLPPNDQPDRSREQTDMKSIAGVAARPAEIRYLLGAVVQLQDLRRATRALEKLSLPVTHLPSTGAFLGRRNVTLLVGMPDGMQPAVIDAIHESCHQRVEYISTPLEGAPMPIPLSSPITVGGATIFTLEIERYEEF